LRRFAKTRGSEAVFRLRRGRLREHNYTIMQLLDQELDLLRIEDEEEMDDMGDDDTGDDDSDGDDMDMDGGDDDDE